MAIRALVATDGSEPGRRTELFVARLARAVPVEMVLVHVLNLESLEYKMIPDFQVAMVREGAKRTAEALLEKERAFLVEKGAQVEPRLLVGVPGPSICELARRESFNFVAVGRKGHGDLQDLLFGSVSNYVVHHCPQPVLVVKKDAPIEESSSRRLRVLVAMDGSKASQRCLDFLLAEADAKSGLDLTLIHVVNPSQAGLEHLPDDARYQTLRKLHDDGQAILDSATVQLSKQGFPCATRVEEGDVGRTLCRVASEDEHDLVIMGRRGMGEVSDLLFGSVCHFVVHHCPRHTLVVS